MHRNRTSILAGAAITLAVAATGCTQPAVWFLPDAPGGETEAFAWEISDDGRIVAGESRSEASTAQHGEGVRWSKPKATSTLGLKSAPWAVETLGFLPGPDKYSPAFGVSGDGRWVVGVGHLGTTLADDSAYAWEFTPAIAAIGRLPGDTFSVAYALSENGEVAAGSSAPLYFRDYRGNRAIFWSRDGNVFGPPKLVDPMPDAPAESRAFDISDDKAAPPNVSPLLKVVGSAQSPDAAVVPAFGIVGHQAMCWVPDTVRKALSYPPGPGIAYSRAFAQSFRGKKIVGFRVREPIPGDPSMTKGALLQAVIWSTSLNSCDEDAPVEDIPLLPGFNSCVAEDVAKGEKIVVGGCSSLAIDATGELEVRAADSFVYEISSKTLRSVSDILASKGETVQKEWIFFQATGVSKDGRWVCGNAAHGPDWDIFAAYVLDLDARGHGAIPPIEPNVPARIPIERWKRATELHAARLR